MTSFTPPMEIAAWLGCLYFTVSLYNGITKAWFNARGKPTPVEAQAAQAALTERVAKIETCIGACKLEQDRRLDAIEESQTATRTLIGTEIDKVYNRVNAVADSTATMTGELKVITSQLNRLLTRG